MQLPHLLRSAHDKPRTPQQVGRGKDCCTACLTFHGRYAAATDRTRLYRSAVGLNPASIDGTIESRCTRGSVRIPTSRKGVRGSFRGIMHAQ
jgi:hypothetical protein